VDENLLGGKMDFGLSIFVGLFPWKQFLRSQILTIFKINFLNSLRFLILLLDEIEISEWHCKPFGELKKFVFKFKLLL